MALATKSGLPGAGKTEMLTHLALKHYHKTNSLTKRIIRKILKREIWINNVYTDYPVCLDLKRKIFAHVVSIHDLNGEYRLLPHAFVGIDEPQLKDDSMDWKTFDRSIAYTLQLHRHAGIDHIYFSTQHPNRLVVYEKNIMSEYERIMSAISIPFTGIKIVFSRKVFEIGSYDVITTKSKEKKQENDIKLRISIFNAKKVHKSYRSTYCDVLFKDKPLLDRGNYESLELTSSQIKEYETMFKNARDQAKFNQKKTMKQSTFETGEPFPRTGGKRERMTLSDYM